MKILGKQRLTKNEADLRERGSFTIFGGGKRIPSAHGKAWVYSQAAYQNVRPQEILMTDIVKEYLRSRNCAEHVVQGGVERLIDNWERVVISVVCGEPQNFYEFLNDMDGRQILSELMSIALPEHDPIVKKRVFVADQKIRSQLVQVNDCIWGNDIAIKNNYDPEHHWWYFHRPLVVDDSWLEK